VNDRPILSTRRADVPASPDALLGAAIRDMTCVRAVYNRNAIRLAPHALYSRNGDLFVDGVVLERDGQPPRELKLGTFKLDGLKALAPAPAPARFDRFSQFDPGAEKYSGEVELLAQVREAAADRARRRVARPTGWAARAG